MDCRGGVCRTKIEKILFDVSLDGVPVAWDLCPDCTYELARPMTGATITVARKGPECAQCGPRLVEREFEPVTDRIKRWTADSPNGVWEG